MRRFNIETADARFAVARTNGMRTAGIDARLALHLVQHALCVVRTLLSCSPWSPMSTPGGDPQMVAGGEAQLKRYKLRLLPVRYGTAIAAS